MFDANKIMEIRQKLNEVGAAVAQIQSKNDKAKNEISKLQGEYTKARYEAKRVERQVKKEAAQEPKKQEFVPYIVLTKDGWLNRVVGEHGDNLVLSVKSQDKTQLFPKSKMLGKLSNPEAATRYLIELHGNPALDAVLDELVAWLKLRREGGNLLTIQMIESKISSLRKAADTMKGGSR